jgi:hypothetical protein
MATISDSVENKSEKIAPQPLSPSQHCALLGAIASVPIDTLETFRNLIKAGFTDKQAEDLVRILFISSHKKEGREKT